MAAVMQEPVKPILKKPPGHRNQTSNPAKPPVHRKPALPPSQKKPSRRRYGRICCCCVCVSLALLIFFLAVAGSLFYLWFAPKVPIFRLRPVRFSRFAVSAEPDGTSNIDARADVWIELKNPNEKLTVYYGETAATPSVDVDVELGSTNLAGLTQASGNITVVRFRSRNKLVLDLATGERLNSTVKSGAVIIKVAVKTTVGVGVGKMKIGMVPIGVWCGGVSLKKLKDGGPPKCKIDWLVWFNR